MAILACANIPYVPQFEFLHRAQNPFLQPFRDCHCVKTLVSFRVEEQDQYQVVPDACSSAEDVEHLHSLMH
jgi:hypothetical protein